MNLQRNIKNEHTNTYNNYTNTIEQVDTHSSSIKERCNKMNRQRQMVTIIDNLCTTIV